MAGKTIAAASNGSHTTIAHALREGAELLHQGGIEGARLDAEVLLCHVLDVTREQLYVRSGGLLAQLVAARYRELIKRRRSRRKEFWSLDLLVTPDVLIPRPETELLVEACLNREKVTETVPLRILDIGTGNGAIAIALAKELHGAKVVASDVSEASLQVARKNARRHGLAERIEFFKGDLFHALPTERPFDLIVGNPPYVRSTELETLPAEIRYWEPLLALDGGRDGLNFYRGIAAEAHRYLTEGGRVLLEIGSDMAADVSRLFSEMHRYAAPTIYQDYSGRDRVFATSNSAV
jgi:release factor glutamine methyltransferase